jgi:acyl-CoA synthetase (AMP-forming)/AMP-acid ligase II
MLNHSEVKALVSVSKHAGFDFSEFFKSFKHRVPTVEKYIFIGEGFEGSLSFAELLKTKHEKTRLDEAKGTVKPDDLAVMIYTSGTTGKPKGVMITHRSILASGRAQAEHFSVTENDIVTASLPLNHVGGITCSITVALICRATAILIPEFKPELVLHEIEKHKATIFSGVPTMYIMLFAYKNFANYDLSSLRLAIAGGSNVEPELCQDISKSMPNARLVNLYGLSESSGACVMSKLTDPPEKVQQTIGVPIGNFQAKIVNENKQVVRIGEIGELAIRGDCLAKGYYHEPEKTMETFSPDGWLYTGDIVVQDEQGYVSFRGRKKEMYIQGGFNIFPVEIENVLTAHPKVSLAAGIGVPDQFFGEVGRYYIIPVHGENPTEEELKEYCQMHLADYKVPKSFVFVDKVPTTPAGKIQKAKLKEEFLASMERN